MARSKRRLVTGLTIRLSRIVASMSAGLPRRPVHAEKALAELDQRYPFVLEVAHDLTGESPDKGRIREHEAEASSGIARY